jgi:AraC family transcriptional regulator, exoenzyme S synthesis regulatory protein ExsA
MKILPQLFYQTPEVKKILVDGLSCVIFKEIKGPVYHKEGYVSTHALVVVRKGQLRAENDKGFLTNVEEGQMLFLPKGLYYISDILPENGVFEAMVFFFDEELIRNFVNSIDLKLKKDKCVSHLVMNFTKELRVFSDSLLSMYAGKEHIHRSVTSLKLMEFLHLVKDAQTSNCFLDALATLNNKERIGLHAFMVSNFSKPLGIEDYAYLTGRSVSTFRRDFIAQFGVSPKHWLIEKRMDRAQQLLANGQSNIADVAAELGYENISHFIKAFRKQYGLPPKQFVMKQRKAVLV